MRQIRIVSLLFLITITLASCKKDEPVATPPTETNPSLFVSFEARVNNEAFVPNAKWYTNFSGDSFTVTKFNYYISNLKFKRSDGTWFSEPESYHLIKHVEEKVSFTIPNLPEGTYTEVQFLIGVDSLRNVSGSQSGDLDPAQQMFWDWNSGYIFYKLEGKCNTLSEPTKIDYAIHIGGFKGKNNYIQSCSFVLPTTINATKNKQSKLFYTVKLEELFVNPIYIDFDYYYHNLTGDIFKELSINYKDMFVVYKVEN